MTRRLQKWHGAGNDFLVDVLAGESDSFWNPARAAAVCARSTGVGADGLLVATLAGGVAMTLYNADGSIAEMSGNGVRCLAAAVRRFTGESWATLRVRTDAGERTVALTLDGTLGYGETSMGEVTFGETLEGTWGVAYVGNPHAVVEDHAQWSSAHCEDVAAKLDAQLGGANVEFVTVLSPSHVRIRVVERGVGWTQACGTGSCAVAAILRREGLAGDEVTVENPGGTLTVRLEGAHATLAGPVQFVADVEWADA